MELAFDMDSQAEAAEKEKKAAKELDVKKENELVIDQTPTG